MWKRTEANGQKLNERDLAAWIERVKRRIDDQEYYMARCMRHEPAALVAAEQFLKHLKAKQRMLETDLTALRAKHDTHLK